MVKGSGMGWAWLVVVVAAMAALAGNVAAERGGPALPALVDRVTDSGHLGLVDGRIVRLAGIRVPTGAAARRRLAALALGRSVRLAPVEVDHDRYERLVAQVETADGVWLQGALLEEGLAQVQTRPGEVARAAAMLAAERVARAAGRGLWAEAAFAPRDAARLAAGDGGFLVVRGRVLGVAPNERYVYLNFGADWRRDFTIRVRRADLDDRFAAAGLDVTALAGKTIEVRGQVIEAGGPLIELSHPEQLEVLR